jgi:hypothetical protein
MTGRAVVIWPDDHDTAAQEISLPYFARQVEGPLFLTPGNMTMHHHEG